MAFLLHPRAAILIGVLFCAGCATLPPEPPNLDPHKQQLRAYHDSGEYLREIGATAAQAQAWLVERAARRSGAEHLAIVFDLDETLLSNWTELSANDFGYVPVTWDAWLDTAKAPPIEPVREVYRTARRLGVEVFFITGRTEEFRAVTERNLRDVDCGEYAALVCKPDNTGTVGAFKTATRQRLSAEGHVIVANVGDQESDLSGGYSERRFKLPDPFYLVK